MLSVTPIVRSLFIQSISLKLIGSAWKNMLFLFYLPFIHIHPPPPLWPLPEPANINCSPPILPPPKIVALDTRPGSAAQQIQNYNKRPQPYKFRSESKRVFGAGVWGGAFHVRSTFILRLAIPSANKCFHITFGVICDFCQASCSV